VTSWCTCKEGYKGKWCEQAPEKEEEKAKWVQTVKTFYTGCKLIKPMFKDVGLDTCQAKCLAGGANAINYRTWGTNCFCYTCFGNPPTPKGGGGFAGLEFVGYYLKK